MTTTIDDVELRALTNAQAHVLVAGGRLEDWHPDYPEDSDVLVARLWLEQPWDPSPRQILYQAQVVGTIGTKGPIVEGSGEIAYTLVPDNRGQGVGTAALGLMIDELAELGTTRVLADATPDNDASQRMLISAGFSVVGENADVILYSKRL